MALGLINKAHLMHIRRIDRYCIVLAINKGNNHMYPKATRNCEGGYVKWEDYEEIKNKLLAEVSRLTEVEKEQNSQIEMLKKDILSISSENRKLGS